MDTAVILQFTEKSLLHTFARLDQVSKDSKTKQEHDIAEKSFNAKPMVSVLVRHRSPCCKKKYCSITNDKFVSCTCSRHFSVWVEVLPMCYFFLNMIQLIVSALSIVYSFFLVLACVVSNIKVISLASLSLLILCI